MTVNIFVPNLGNEVTEAEISEWMFDEGEQVTEGEVLVVISTTKTSLEIESPSGGRLAKINFREGELVEIGAILGIIEQI